MLGLEHLPSPCQNPVQDSRPLPFEIDPPVTGKAVVASEALDAVMWARWRQVLSIVQR
jgi:hypothetical protein